MPPKAAPAARRPAQSRKKKDAVEIVVRRGAMRRFDALKTKTAELPVTITWDRRLTDRREEESGSRRERRQSERRRQPPFTWDLADFVVIEPTKRKKTARKTKSRKS